MGKQNKKGLLCKAIGMMVFICVLFSMSAVQNQVIINKRVKVQ